VAGISRTAWYRLWSAGQAPDPIALPGVENRWRVADITRWVASLKTKKTRRPARGGRRKSDRQDGAPTKEGGGR
jgi:predicted DNA-binding transcriptional regulator AlpA